MDAWKDHIKAVVNKKIHSSKHNVNQPPPKTLDNEEVRSYLTTFHQRFVLVPADKASNNIIVICKPYYIQTLCQELGIIASSTKNNTYTKDNSNLEDIIKNHVNYFKKLNIVIPPSQHDLPMIYWIPKIHKSPYKQRFIAGSKSCTTKALSSILTRALQKVKDNHALYCKAIERTTGVNRMWILKNSKTLLSELKDKNISKVTHISTWDFSTLYTTIPHKQLKERICSLIKFCMNTASRQYINIGPFKAFFSQTPYDGKGYVSWTCKQFCRMFCFLVDNIFIKFGQEVFRQTIGIPMGTDCAPVVADLFLFSYEYNFLEKLTKEKKLHLAKKFNLVFRYIDDLFSLNIEDFGKYAKEIYPPELELKETTEGKTTASYLDLSITISNGMLQFKLYDKRDDFNFNIVNYPHIDSNIPEKPAYGVYVSQLVRYSLACSSYTDFLSRHRTLVTKLVSQGYTTELLRRHFIRFYNSNNEILHKYNVSLKDHIRHGIIQSATTAHPSVCATPSDGNTHGSSASTDFISLSSSPVLPGPSDNHSHNTSLVSTHDNISSTYQPKGLPNLGNTCYLNSITQCLLASSISVDFIDTNDHDTEYSRNLFNIMYSLRTVHNTQSNIMQTFRGFLGKKDPFFESPNQQDAHEALLKILSILDDCTKFNIYGDQLDITPIFSSVIRDTFYGSMKCVVTCTVCKRTKVSIEEFNSLSVDTKTSVTEGIQTLLNESSFTQNCDWCSESTLHTSQSAIWNQPAITVIYINRFNQVDNGNTTKNDSVVHCDPLLSAPGFVGRLVGVVLHKGTTVSSGHYTSLVFSGHCWYSCNDSHVAAIKDISTIFHSKEAYLLFYIK